MNKLLTLSVIGLLSIIISCNPQEDDKIDIGGPPQNVSFDIVASSTPNKYTFTNKTPDVFQYFWSFGSAGTATGSVVEKTIAFKGNYTITLTVFGKGGSASASKTLNVPNDAPIDCESDALYKFLTKCDKKIWRLEPAPGSLWVGPTDGSATWWAIGQADIDARSCQFNDEWIFSKDGKMQYDAKGDVFGEPYMGGINFICEQESKLLPAFKPWGSGTHSFELIAGTPRKLKVTGLGAFIGIPKAANGAEVTTPQQSVTYDVVKWETKAGKDFLEVQVNFGAGIWRFQLSSK